MQTTLRLWKYLRLFVLAALIAGLAGVPSPQPTAQAQSFDSDALPIVDLHFHPDAGWNVDALVQLFDELGVARAGNAADGPDSVAFDFAARYPDRFIAFAGMERFGRILQRDGASAWHLASPAMQEYVGQVEEWVRTGQIRGIGEIHVNNARSSAVGWVIPPSPADSALMQYLWLLSATYRAPVSVHMDAAENSVSEMERLLVSNRDATWLWAHCGFYAEPPLLRRVLAEHPNLVCELSYRESFRGSRTAVPFDVGGRLRPEWLELLEEHPSRFVIGSDIAAPSMSGYANIIRFWRGILRQLSPDAARMIAYENADRLVPRR